MENLPGDMAQNSKITRHRPQSAEPRSWTLLLVGALGNIVSFRLTKTLVVILTGGLTAIFALVVFATFSYYGMRTENKKLRKDLDKVEADLVAANKAKELALVRLILLEAEGKRGEEKNEPPFDQNTPVQISQPGKSPAPPIQDTKKAASKVVKPITKPSPPQVTETAQAQKSASSESLLIKKLQIWQDAESDSVRFKFSLTNIDPHGRRIKGYTFVVLKPEKGSQEPFRVSPWASLEDGRPALFKKGQYFSIARFKFVSGTFLGVERAEPFKTATVYVYSETGDLMLEQVYHVDKILRA